MKTIIALVFLCFCSSIFSQNNERTHNIIVAFDSSLVLSRENVLQELSLQVDGFQELLVEFDFDLKYAYAFSDEKLKELEKHALKSIGNSSSIQNLKNTFEIVVSDANDLNALKDKLQLLPKLRYVEMMDIRPIQPPSDIPPTTPNYLPQQTYSGPNPGVNMQYAWAMNLNGQGIRIRNVEYGFNKSHEEFHQNNRIFLAPGYTVHPAMTADWTEHGTGTFGVIFGDDSMYGVKGLAYGAEEVVLYPEYTVEYLYNRAYATSLALNDSEAGDVVMFEMQANGFNATETSPNYVPAEYSLPIWDLTKAASDVGIIVVAAAGNGDQNLDAPQYSSYMARGNSGAIIVGAGKPNMSHNRLYYANWWGSTYGSRVNLQGWGENVLSSGYGDFSTIGGDFNQQYTMFSGTSSATPMVASCVAVLQSYYYSLTGAYLNSGEMISILQATGYPQGTGVVGNVGPLPNMQAAVGYIQTLGIKDIEDLNFNVFPNPFEDELNISIAADTQNLSAELYNLVGQKVLELSFSGEVQFSTEHLQAGMYVLKLIQDDTIVTHVKLIKK